MSTFKSVPLQEVAVLNPRLGIRLADDSAVSFVPMAALSAEKASIDGAIVRPYVEVKKGYTCFESGDVLVAKITPCFENGKIAQALLTHQNGFGSTEFHVVRPKPKVADGRYLHHYLRQPGIRAGGERRMTGSGGQRRVPESYIAGLVVPVPPLPEQRRIAAILDQADALRAKRREALAQLDSLTQSIFIEMFGDPIQNTMCWQVENLESVADFFAGNSLPAGVPYERQVGGHLLMKVSDMNLSENEQFITRCQSWTAAGGARSATCPAGSVVVPKRGGAISTNKKRITTRATILDPNLMAIAPRRSLLNLSYLYQWFMRFDLASISSGSSVPQLNKQDLAPLKIQVPPLALQQAFATRIQAVESLKATHRTAMAESDALFASLQHRAFAGQLS